MLLQALSVRLGARTPMLCRADWSAARIGRVLPIRAVNGVRSAVLTGLPWVGARRESGPVFIAVGHALIAVEKATTAAGALSAVAVKEGD